MRGILIDPNTKTVTGITGNFSDYKLIQRTVGGLFTVVDLGNGETLYLDDEGLLKAEPGPFFNILPYPQPLAGVGLILGTDENGETVSTKLTVPAVTARASFPNLRFTGFTHETTTVKHPLFGDEAVPCLSTVPHFEAADD
jgi:hypothetical protein